MTVLKDKELRRSKGVAFILFLKGEDAKKCVEEINLKEVRDELINYLITYKICKNFTDVRKNFKS